MSKREALLRSLYYNPAAPGSYSSASRLLKAAQKKAKQTKKRGLKLDKAKVQTFLAGEDTYTLHRPVRRKYERRRVVVSGALSQFQSDLVDMSAWEEENDGYRWLLMTIDCFSKMGWAIPVKRKDAKQMVPAFQKLLEEKTPPPDKLQTDKGTEFTNKAVQAYLKKKKVTWFASEDDYIKAGVVERLNRTIQGKMWKYFHHRKNHRWVDVIDRLMTSYNRTYHSSIKMTPEEAHQPEREPEVRRNLYGEDSRLPSRGWRIPDGARPLKVGDKVKISKHAVTFDRGYLPNWTEEVFVIREVVSESPVVYRLEDLKGESILGVFYQEELQKVQQDVQTRTYAIEKVLEEKEDQVLVKWKGYPNKFNEWIPKSALRGGTFT